MATTSPFPKPTSGYSASRPPRAAASGRTTFVLFALLMIWTVALPKGGISVGGTPLSFGYILVGVLAPIALVGLLARTRPSPIPLLHFLVLYFPLALIAVFKVIDGQASPTVVLVIAVTFLILPAIVLAFFASHLEALTEQDIGTVFKWCMFFAVAWGLMNFVLYAMSKNIIQIPYLTINGADFGAVFEKNNRRGNLMKLISTYNNGNIAGICFLMMTPLFMHFVKSRIWRVLLCIAIVCTLSRTAWFGLMAVFFIMIVMGQIRATNPLTWLAVVAALGLVVLLLPVMGWTPDKLFDSSLGGRSFQWDFEWTVFGESRYNIGEILYAGLIDTFGVLGFLLALLALAFPVVYGLLRFDNLSGVRKAALAGIIVYLVIAMFDAAFIFPPVFLQFLMLAALLYRRGFDGSRPS